MGRINRLIRRFSPGATISDLPALPKPRHSYVLTSSDMVHFDLLDGDEECGGVELMSETENQAGLWVVHVYGIDLQFSTLGKARKWLGKPPIQMG